MDGSKEISFGMKNYYNIVKTFGLHRILATDNLYVHNGKNRFLDT